MTARCTKCSKGYSFGNLHGQKLSHHKCACGGVLQIMGRKEIIYTNDNDNKSILSFYDMDDTNYVTERNRKGQRFVLNPQGYYIHVA